MFDLDLVGAILHHLFVFAMFAVLFAEFVSVRPGMDDATVARTAAIDASYRALAGLILIVGFARAIFAAKGWDYYAHNAFFWAKIGTFAVIGLLSVPPTRALLRWRRTSSAFPLAGGDAVSATAGFRGGDGSRLWSVLTGPSRIRP